MSRTPKAPYERIRRDIDLMNNIADAKVLLKNLLAELIRAHKYIQDDLITAEKGPRVMTSAQRDTLSPRNGEVIFNETTGKLQARESGSWTDII